MINWFEKHNKLSWLITIFGAIMIFYISSLTFGVGVSSISIISILYHISVFFCFSLFLLISLMKRKFSFFVLVLGVMISIFYAISDEIHQFFVPGRFCSFSDIFLDIIGISFACLAYLISKYKVLNKGYQKL